MSKYKYRQAVTYYGGGCGLDGMHIAHQWVRGMDNAGNVIVNYCTGQYAYCGNCGDGGRLRGDEQCGVCDGPPFDPEEVTLDLLAAERYHRHLGEGL